MFPVHFFDGVVDFKNVVRSLHNEFQQLIGDTRILFALKKSSSIGNTVVQNKHLSFPLATLQWSWLSSVPTDQRRNIVEINGNTLRIPRHLNCKSKNIIYMWICKLCGAKETYFGRTIQESHDRSSGHRGCFNGEKWEKSALSMHAREVHQTNFSLDIFKIAVVKKVSPKD